jgi:hypothetical protein
VPALLLLYAVISLVAVPFLCRAVWDDVQSGRALAAPDHCAGGDCLVEVDGLLLGPFGKRRTVNEDWSLVSAEGEHLSFEVGPRTSERLAPSRDHVTGLLYRGDVVAVVTGDGETLPTLEGGSRAAVFTGSWAMTAMLAGPLLGQLAVRMRRASGGWWRRDGAPTTPYPVPAALLLGASCTGCAMLFGAGWPLALGLGGAILVGFAYAYLTRGSRPSGRHSASG